MKNAAAMHNSLLRLRAVLYCFHALNLLLLSIELLPRLCRAIISRYCCTSTLWKNGRRLIPLGTESQRVYPAQRGRIVAKSNTARRFPAAVHQPEVCHALESAIQAFFQGDVLYSYRVYPKVCIFSVGILNQAIPKCVQKIPHLKKYFLCAIKQRSLCAFV